MSDQDSNPKQTGRYELAVKLWLEYRMNDMRLPMFNELPLTTQLYAQYIVGHFMALAEENAQLRKALKMLYERWENGTPSYEDPEDKTGYLGLACKVTAMEEQEIIAALEVKP